MTRDGESGVAVLWVWWAGGPAGGDPEVGGEEGGVVLHARRVCGPAESGRSFTRVELLMIPLGRFRSTLASDSHCH